jgi:hypothetical protein
MPSSEVDDFVRQVELAVTHASGRLGAARLRVASVAVSIQTSLIREAGGSLNIKVVEIGGTVDRDATQVIDLEFMPKPVALFSEELDEDLIEAIETIESVIREVQETFMLATADVTLRLGRSSSGKVQVLIGGKVTTGHVHTATIRLVPA